MSQAPPGSAPAAADLDQDLQMLARELPHWAARATGVFIVLLFAAAAVAAVLVQVPETVTCPFVLAPPQGTDPIRSGWRGTVEAVGVTDGQDVTKGQVLYRIRSSEIRTLATELATLRKEETGARDRLANLRAEYAAQQKADAAEDARLTDKAEHLAAEATGARTQMKLRQEAAAAARKIQEATIAGSTAEVAVRRTTATTYAEYLKRLDEAERSGTVSWVEHMNQKLAKGKADLDLETAQRAEAMARLRLEQMDVDERKQDAEDRLAAERLESERREALSLLAKLRQEAAARAAAQVEKERALATDLEKSVLRGAALTRDLADTADDVSLVTAPFAGTVLALRCQEPGAVVERGQELCQLARAGGPLQAELTLPESAAGRVRTGMEVKLLYAAFPYQRYGVRVGTVRWVSPGAAVGKDGAQFRALAEPADTTVRVGGEARPLRAGMGGEARVVVGRRTLVEFAVEPLRQLRESLR